MIDGPAGSGPRGRVVGVYGIPNSLAALRRAAGQARHRDTGLNIVPIPAGAHEAAEASSYQMPGIAWRHVAPAGPGGRVDSGADQRARAARPAARVLRATGSDVR